MHAHVDTETLYAICKNISQHVSQYCFHYIFDSSNRQPTSNFQNFQSEYVRLTVQKRFRLWNHGWADNYNWCQWLWSYQSNNIFRNYSSSNLESDVLAASNCSKCQMKFTFFIMINYVGHNIKRSKFNFSKRFKKKLFHLYY